MENSSSSSELQKLIEAIKISEVCDLYCGGRADAEKYSLSYLFVKREKNILDNLETLLQEKDIQADLVCCLQHLQLRFETEDKAKETSK